MRATPSSYPRRVGVALLAIGFASVAQAASGSDPPSASPSLWSVDRSLSACHPARVEMIVGGMPESTECADSNRAAAAPAFNGREARVDAGTQRVRDVDRRAILQQEVARERDELARLGSATSSEANRQALERTRTNLAALQRELSRAP